MATEQTERADDVFLAGLGFHPANFTSPEHKAAVLAELAPRRATLERLLRPAKGAHTSNAN